MNYTKVVYPQIIPGVPHSRPALPSNLIRLYATSLYWDLTSDDPNKRSEYWENLNGEMTQEEVDNELYGITGGKLTTTYNLVTTQLITLNLGFFQFKGILEAAVNNMLENENWFSLHRIMDNSTLENIFLRKNQSLVIRIPDPYSNYGLKLNSDLNITFQPYKTE